MTALLGGLFAPFWLPLAAMALLSMLFRSWEVPFLGLILDLLWLPTVGFLHPIPVFTITGILLMWVFEPLRREFLV